MEEQTFLNESGDTVTNSRFIVPGETFAMSGVTSVKTREHKPSRIGPIIFILMGLISFAMGKDMIIGAFMFLSIGIAWWILHKPKYIVVLTTASREAPAFSNKNKDFIIRIEDSLNEAIVARG